MASSELNDVFTTLDDVKDRLYTPTNVQSYLAVNSKEPVKLERTDSVEPLGYNTGQYVTDKAQLTEQDKIITQPEEDEQTGTDLHNKPLESDHSNIIVLKDKSLPTLDEYKQDCFSKYENNVQVFETIKEDKNLVISTAGRKLERCDLLTILPSLEKNDEEEVKKYFGKNHWQTGWIADKVINAFGAVLQQESKYRIHILDTMISLAILNNDWSLWEGNKDAIDGYIQFLKDEMQKIYHLIVPLLIKFHWRLLVYDVTTKTCRWYDSCFDESLKEDLTPVKKKYMIDKAQLIISFLFPNGGEENDLKLTLRNPFFPQTDGMNCGAYLCMYMLFEAGLVWIKEKKLNTDDARRLILYMLFKCREIMLPEGCAEEIDIQEMKMQEDKPEDDEGDVINLKEKKE